MQTFVRMMRVYILNIWLIVSLLSNTANLIHHVCFELCFLPRQPRPVPGVTGPVKHYSTLGPTNLLALGKEGRQEGRL